MYRFGCVRSRSRLSVTDSGVVQPASVPESLEQVDRAHAALACQAPPLQLQSTQRQAALSQGLCAGQVQQELHRVPQPVPLTVAALQTGNPTMAVANLIAGHSLARLPPPELALLIANHDGSDAALTQALQCAMSALSDAQLGNVGCAPHLLCHGGHLPDLHCRVCILMPCHSVCTVATRQRIKQFSPYPN